MRRRYYSRELAGSIEDHADDDVWTPLRNTDYVHLGLTSSYQCVVLVTVAHLWWCRKWPPYVPRQIPLCAISGLAGVVAYIGALIAYGVIYRDEEDFIGEQWYPFRFIRAVPRGSCLSRYLTRCNCTYMFVALDALLPGHCQSEPAR